MNFITQNFLAAKKNAPFGLLVIVFIFCANGAFSQRERALNWAFPRFNGLDFEASPPSTFTSAALAFGSLTQSTSTISDLNGNLLFYSNGEFAWNRNHQLMPNGSGLMGSEETTQSSLIVPYPNNPDRYYLFTLDDNGGGDGLNYYIVDMTFAGGLGDVVSAAIHLADTLTEKLVGVKHANDYDYWVVVHKWRSDSFLSFKVDSFGVAATPVISEVGLAHNGLANGVMGQMKISPDGTRLALGSFSGGFVQLFDFDDSTGVVSNPLTLQNYGGNFPFGIEFSPDSRKLYYTQRFSDDPPAKIFQYDLDHLDTECLLASEYVIAQINFLKVPSNLQLATDGKIYMTVNYYSNYDTLAVIHNPNEYGAACNFDEFGISTDTSIVEGLTGFVSSYLSDGIHLVFGTACDGAQTRFYPEDSLNLDSVLWNFGDPSTGTANTSTTKEAWHVFSTPDTFLVTLYAFAGNSVDTFFRNVVIWDTAINLIGKDTTICNGTPIQFTADWYNSCLLWSTGSTDNTITVNTEGYYWVDVYYQSCYFRDSVFVNGVTGPPQFTLGQDTSICNNANFVIDPVLPYAYYTWQDGSHDTVFTATGTGVYWLSASNACGSSSDTLFVTLNFTAQPAINFPTDTVVCDSSAFLIDVSFDDAIYLWSDGTTSPTKQITTSGTYWVRVSNLCDTVSDTISVEFHSPLESAMLNENIHCGEGDTLILKATADSASSVWNSSIAAQVYEVTEAGTYWYTTTNACGILSDTIQIQAWDTGFVLNLGTDTVLCNEGIEIQIGHESRLYLFEYLWSTGSKAPSVSVKAGSYSLVVTNRCTTLNDQIFIARAPAISIAEPASLTVCDDSTLELKLAADFAKSILWSNGDSSFSIEINEAGIYSVSAVDSNNCAFADSILINDNCPPIVFIPNVFTPNNDLYNDDFCVRVKNVDRMTLTLYNRWGTAIYTSAEINACWDGNISGNSADDGVYFYTCDVYDADNQLITYRGTFSLLR